VSCIRGDSYIRSHTYVCMLVFGAAGHLIRRACSRQGFLTRLSSGFRAARPSCSVTRPVRYGGRQHPSWAVPATGFLHKRLKPESRRCVVSRKNFRRDTTHVCYRVAVVCSRPGTRTTV